MKHIDIRKTAYTKFDVVYRQAHKLTSMLDIMINDHVRISKYKIFFSNHFTQNWLEEVFVINKIKSTVSGAYFILMV